MAWACAWEGEAELHSVNQQAHAAVGAELAAIGARRICNLDDLASAQALCNLDALASVASVAALRRRSPSSATPWK